MILWMLTRGRFNSRKPRASGDDPGRADRGDGPGQ